jgi:hypothetical protein
MAVAALAARDMPGMYAEQMNQLVANTLEIYSKTGMQAQLHLHLTMHLLLQSLVPPIGLSAVPCPSFAAQWLQFLICPMLNGANCGELAQEIILL